MSEALEWAKLWYNLKTDFKKKKDLKNDNHLRLQGRVPVYDEASIQRLDEILGTTSDYDLNAADFYVEHQTTAEENNLIPRWDISLAQLEPIYHQARLDRAYEWKYKRCADYSIYSRKCFHKMLPKKRYMRRIPWLFPDNGKFSCRITPHLES